MSLKKTKEGEYIEWTAVFDLNGNGNFIGVAKDGIWYADTAEGLKLVNGPGIAGVLPILENTKEEFLAFLTEKLGKVNIGDVNSFPITQVIHFSLSVSSYWAELGIEWLDEKDINDGLAMMLNKKIYNKEFSQKFRQKAFKKIKRWKQLNG